jgi:hypothetical protein
VLSRYQWVVPLTDKTGKTLKDALQVIFKSGWRPVRLQTDKGTEFINRVFQTFLKEHDMHFFTTYNEETKASIVVSFSRTLKTKMWKYFTHRETLTYVDVLSEMVASYDHTVHRTIGMGKYPVFNVRLALLSRTLSPGENLHDLLGPFLPYSLLDTVVWLAQVTSAGGMPMVL